MSEAGKMLIQKGFRQGGYIYGKDLDKQTLTLLQQGRSEIKKRLKPIQDKHLLLLISQDCDINGGSASSVEFLVGRQLKKREIGDPQFYKGRSFQKLYLRIDDEHWCFELSLQASIEKNDLLTCIQSGATKCSSLDNVNYQILLTWLSSKYIRVPFPHGFNTIFLQYVRKENPENRLAECLERNAVYILDLFAYVSPDDDNAESYDVILVLALKLNVPSDIYDELVAEMTVFVDMLHNQFSPTFIMKQIDNTAGEILDNVDYVQRPEEFIKSDELKMSPLTLNYLCWSDDSSEAPV